MRTDTTLNPQLQRALDVISAQLEHAGAQSAHIGSIWERADAGDMPGMAKAISWAWFMIK